jgi:hypothetical protein
MALTFPLGSLNGMVGAASESLFNVCQPPGYRGEGLQAERQREGSGQLPKPLPGSSEKLLPCEGVWLQK